jgi:hypothetical protein
LEQTKKKVVRLFYAVWSGVTKYLRNLVQCQQRAVEVQGLGIFSPVFASPKLRDPLNKGPVKPVSQFLPNPVFFVMDDDLLNEMNWEVAVDTTTIKAVGRYNKNDKSEVLELFNQIHPLNFGSIAAVCNTDS